MASNPPLTDPPLSLALEYARWKGWRDKVYGRLHPSRRKRLCAWARLSLPFHGRMNYTEGPQRSELFHRARGNYLGAHADCSQYAASLAHWAGFRSVTDTDWTGTLATKGVMVEQPIAGCLVLFGAPPYVHSAIMDTPTTCVGFGDQAAPSRNTLATMLAYFAGHGHSGHAFRVLTR